MKEVHEVAGLEEPLVEVRFRTASEAEKQGCPREDTFVVQECPYCSEEHTPQVTRHPEVVLGGLSRTRCPNRRKDTDSQLESVYYIVLQQCGVNLPYEIVHSARRKLMNLPGDELQRPLVPKGIDPRAIADVLHHWSE